MPKEIPANVLRSVLCAIGLLVLGTLSSVYSIMNVGGVTAGFCCVVVSSSCWFVFWQKSPRPLDCSSCRSLPPSPTGLALFISGMVLWRVEGTSALIGLWVCGLLVFIPGFYFTRVAYLARQGAAGYSWADIPEWPTEWILSQRSLPIGFLWPCFRVV